MTRFNEIYERYRSLIIWLGLGELTWIGYWLLGSGNTSPGYAATTVVWIALMLVWMMTAISLANKGVFLKYTYRFSNLLGFLFVLFFSAFLFGIIGTATRGLLIAEPIVAPEISIRNLDKTKPVYPRFAALPARFYSGIN